MKEKNFSLSVNGPCDDALDDTIHTDYVAYIESEKVLDSIAIIEFKFKSSCCQEFLGDYKIKNDTLFFEFEQVNDEVCACICWYRYKLRINKLEHKVTNIQINGL